MRKLLLACVLALIVGPVSAATITVVPSAPAADIGEQIAVDVTISDVADLYAFQLDLSFAPGVLAVSNASHITDGMFLNTGGFFPGFINNAFGTITFIAHSLVGPVPGVSGAGTLARIRFTAVGPGTSPIRVENPVLLDSNLSDIAAATNGSSITVPGIPEPGTMTLMLVAGIALATTRLIRNRGRS